MHNPTAKIHEISMTVEQSEGMVYAGTMQTTIKILPFSSHPIQMSCYPINAGLIRLPRVKLVVNKRKGTRKDNHVPSVSQEEVLVKVRGASLSNTRESTTSPSTTTSTTAPSLGSEAIVIFVKPEAGLVE